MLMFLCLCMLTSPIPLAARVTEQTEQGGLINPIVRVYQVGYEGPLNLAATIVGEGQSKIKPRVDDTLGAVVKASHIRE